MIDPPDIDMSFVPVRAGTSATEVLDGEAVIYNEALDTVHSLSTTATLIWSMMDGTVSIQDLAAEFAEHFDVDLAVVGSDVLRTVREFGRLGLLVGVRADTEAVIATTVGRPASDPES